MSTARAASIAAIAFSPALIASMIASTWESVVDDVLPDTSCVLLELSADISVLMMGPPVDVLIGPVNVLIGPVDVLIGPADDVSDSVNPVLVDIIVVLLDWFSEKLVLVPGVVLEGEGFDSPVVGLLDPPVLDPPVLDPPVLNPLVPDVLVSASMAAIAASYFSVSAAITAVWVLTTSSAASLAVFTCNIRLILK